MPSGWGDWTFWQYTDDNNVPGISGGVDSSYSKGSLEDLFIRAGLKKATNITGKLH